MAPISGAPRTCMDLMACAASASVPISRMASSCGSLVWSMKATDQPFLPSQMVR